ncbi:MAG: NYN domain-containing protein [Bacteroidia bacterium]
MNKMIKIGVFYDGNYFSNVSNYYNYQHFRKSRINIQGLHEFIRHQVAQEEGAEVKNCKITDAHYFRGRLNADDAVKLNKLYYERVFDDMLMKEGVVTHYLPLVNRKDGTREEKGVDVTLALEAYELTIFKQFDVVALIACDGDYLPLVRKIHTRGARVMVLSWDFSYVDDFGNERGTVTSQDLLEAANYPLAMHEIIDNRVRRNEPLINNLFRPFETKSILAANLGTNVPYPAYTRPTAKPQSINGNGTHPDYDVDEKPKISTICNLQKEKGFGFITYTPDNVFFHFSQIIDNDEHNTLAIGDMVEFVIGRNERDGKAMAKSVKRITGIPAGYPKEEIYLPSEMSEDLALELTVKTEEE